MKADQDYSEYVTIPNEMLFILHHFITLYSFILIMKLYIKRLIYGILHLWI